MMLALLLATATPQTAIDAERAFAAAAQKDGQWTAFRRFADDDATMFVPQPTNAQAWLKDRKNPPKSIEWWPTASYVSCDGRLAVNTGGWKQLDGSVGYFSTVWVKQTDGGWKWIVDGGDNLKVARDRPATPKLVKASCVAAKAGEADGNDPTHGSGGSADRSLLWGWGLNATGHTRVFSADLWDGKRYVGVVENLIAIP